MNQTGRTELSGSGRRSKTMNDYTDQREKRMSEGRITKAITCSTCRRIALGRKIARVARGFQVDGCCSEENACGFSEN
jgi:hypothetical protein